MKKLKIKYKYFYLIVIIVILILCVGLWFGLKSTNNSSSRSTTITVKEAESKALSYASEKDNITKIPNQDGKTYKVTNISVTQAIKNPKKSGGFIVYLLGLVYDLQQPDHAAFAVNYSEVSVVQNWGQELWPVNTKICGCPLIGTYDNTNNKNNKALLAGFSIDKNHSYNDINQLIGGTDGWDVNFNPIKNWYAKISGDGVLEDDYYFSFTAYPIKKNPFIEINVNGSGIEKLTTNGIKFGDNVYLYLGWTSSNPDKIYFVLGKSSDGKATSITNNANNIEFFYYSSAISPNTNGGALDVEYSK